MGKEADTPGDQTVRLGLRLAAIACLALLVAYFGFLWVSKAYATRRYS